MISKKIRLWEKEEYHYQGSFGFIPSIVTYIHEEDMEARPCIVIVPGGGYKMVSPGEAELVAIEFYERGWNAFVCIYTTDFLQDMPLKDQPMKDLSRAIRLIRKNAAEFRIRPDKVAVCGFSAGAHLCGSVCVHFIDVADENKEYQGISNRPDAAVLSYPVITAGNGANRDSFATLLGNDAMEEELEYMSLEKQVSSQTPPCFIWHTATDELVPVQNSLLYARACEKAGVPFALHVFSDGPHGLSLANKAWESGRSWNLYTLEQIKCAEYFFKENNISVPEPLKIFIREVEEMITEKKTKEKDSSFRGRKANREVAAWPELAETWLLEKILL